MMLDNIGIIGVGGGGSNSVIDLYDEMAAIGRGLNLDFAVVNTDVQAFALVKNRKIRKIAIGAQLTSGGGAGADPVVGYLAAQESGREIADWLRGKSMLFVSLGLGGGTGSGASPKILEIAKQLNILTIVFATYPWDFEGKRRQNNSRLSLNSLYEFADSIVIINNDDLGLGDLKGKADAKVLIQELFKQVNKYLKFCVLAIASMVLEKSFINIDFNDIKRVLTNSHFGFFFLSESRINSRMTEDEMASIFVNDIIAKLPDSLALENSKNLVVNVAGNSNTLSVTSVTKSLKRVSQLSSELDIIFGLSFNDFIQPGIVQFTGLFTEVGYEQNNISDSIDVTDTLGKMLEERQKEMQFQMDEQRLQEGGGFMPGPPEPQPQGKGKKGRKRK